jgi:hypothetical protein
MIRSEPSGTELNRLTLSISKPAPTSNVSDSITSAATNVLPKAWATGPKEALRPLALSASIKSTREAFSAGANPNISAVATANPP